MIVINVSCYNLRPTIVRATTSFLPVNQIQNEGSSIWYMYVFTIYGTYSK